jgi:hypothetical protein
LKALSSFETSGKKRGDTASRSGRPASASIFFSMHVMEKPPDEDQKLPKHVAVEDNCMNNVLNAVSTKTVNIDID